MKPDPNPLHRPGIEIIAIPGAVRQGPIPAASLLPDFHNSLDWLVTGEDVGPIRFEHRLSLLEHHAHIPYGSGPLSESKGALLSHLLNGLKNGIQGDTGEGAAHTDALHAYRREV